MQSGMIKFVVQFQFQQILITNYGIGGIEMVCSKRRWEVGINVGNYIGEGFGVQ